MPLREDLLTPIPGANPSGEYLYYSPIYDKIKEARREDDDAGPAGIWQRERKVADWNLVIKLAGEALATKSKDLQIASWLTEAHLKKEGFSAFKQCLDLLRELMEQFWDTLYPEIEDGDSEFRATPLNWVGNFDLQVRLSPLTRSGYNSVDYKVSRGVGYKADAEADSAKFELFNEKLKEGKLSADDFDSDLDKTPKKFYVDLTENIQNCLEALEALQALSEEKFGDYAPGYTKLRTALEETLNTVKILLNRKREKEPDAPAATPVAEEPATDTAYEEHSSYAAPAAAAATAAAPARAPRRTGALSPEPQDMDDAVERVLAVARYIRAQDAYSPSPYLMLAGLRIGELRAGGDTIDQTKLEAPPGEIRQLIKKLSLEYNWTEVLTTAEMAIGLPCGRAWIDVHRYIAKACTELGWYYEGYKKAVVATVRSLLQDYPDLQKMTLLDDTPTANGETIAWIESDVLAGAQSGPPAVAAYAPYTPPPAQVAAAPAPGEAAAPDVWDLAVQALRGGRVLEAVELLDREAKMEQSGRGRFLRKTQLARIFMDSGNEPMALPILEHLVGEIEARRLEDWEPSEAISHPLALLYRCVARADRNSEEARKLYAKLCRLDPVAAMNVLR